jgi:hypothetical protein
LTRASGGYIIKISPTAIGIEVVPTEYDESDFARLGKRCPENTPIAIAIKIQRVRKRSRKDNLF